MREAWRDRLQAIQEACGDSALEIWVALRHLIHLCVSGGSLICEAPPSQADFT